MALSFLQTTTSTADTNQYTFSAQNLGTVSSDRYIIIHAVARKAGASFSLSSISVGGITAELVTQITNTVTNSDCSSLSIALVPTGATGDVIVTWSTTVLRCAIGVWRADNLASAVAFDYISDSSLDPTVTIDVPIGFVVGGGLTSGATSSSWTGLAEKYDATLETYVEYTGASDEFTEAQTGRTISIDFNTPTESAGSFASWAYSTDAATITGVQSITGIGSITL